jgi:hypothetical protein
MEDLMGLITENKNLLIIVVIVMMFFPQAKNGLSWVWDLLKKLRGKDDNQLLPWGDVESEMADFQALKYLRTRAKEIGDEEIVQSVKMIQGRLFDSYE